METKLDKVKFLILNGSKFEALKIVAKFPRLGSESDIIRTGWDAYQNPKFYQQIKKDPSILIDEAINAIIRKYKIQ